MSRLKGWKISVVLLMETELFASYWFGGAPRKYFFGWFFNQINRQMVWSNESSEETREIRMDVKNTANG